MLKYPWWQSDMHLTQNGILERLGLTNAALEQARKTDSVLEELCADLEVLAVASVDQSPYSAPPDHHLVRLIRSLETEIRDRLSKPNHTSKTQ